MPFMVDELAPRVSGTGHAGRSAPACVDHDDEEHL